jgi:hypothetical protein
VTQSTTQSNCNCMCPVVRPQFIHQIFDVKVDHVLRDRQFVGDLFVPVTIPNQL